VDNFAFAKTRITYGQIDLLTSLSINLTTSYPSFAHNNSDIIITFKNLKYFDLKHQLRQSEINNYTRFSEDPKNIILSRQKFYIVIDIVFT
jgi:hypothetical protein